ncbi:MAG: hypothetical protein GX625_21845 [Clostridiaceae bacterium]|nr:hypothetical protein [Clostridiaceae bacterium]
MLLLIASLLLIPSVIGYEASHTFDASYSYDEYGTYKSSGGPVGFSALRFKNIEDFSGLKHVAVVYDHISYGVEGYPDAGTTSVTGTIESNVIFTGRIGYNINRDKGGSVTNVVLWIDEINNFDPHGYNGRKDVQLEWNKSIVPTPNTYGATMINASVPDFAAASDRFQSNWVLLAPYSDVSNTVGQYGRYMYLIEQPWKNTVHVVYDDTGYDIQLYRHGFFSSVDITEIATGISYYSTPLASTDVNIHIPGVWLMDPKLNISVITGSNERLSWEVNPPPLDQPILVPVAVRSAQTGDPIAGAQVAILDTKTNETISITLASGSGTVNLPETTSFRYHASAAAANYTLISPIVFGVVEGTSIVLWMSPDAPPDVPTEPEKSMLYGYVQTQGSQQPISGATVSLDDYGSTTTSSTGFYLFNNVTPGAYTISASAPLHDALSEPVTVETVATPYNLALKGHFLLTVTAMDDTSLVNLHNATISLSDGQESTQNPATFSADYGPYTVTAVAAGYYPQAQSVYLNNPGTTTATILLTERLPPATPAEMPNYPPHNVRFHCIDDFGLPLSNVSVSAKYLETTSPWSWFSDLLGIPSSVNINATTLSGTTGTDGSITFSMVETVRYAITAHDPASNLSVNFTLYPQETQYTIQFRTRPPSDAETHPLYNLEAVPLAGDTQVSLRFAYKDRDNATTSLLFWVKDGADEYVHTEALTPKYLNWTNASYTVENRPTSYTWGFDANHATRGEISAARSITLHGSGRLVDLGFEDEFWYLLLSAIWIVGIGAIFSGSRVRFGAIIIPLIGGGVPTLIGWLPLATTVPIGILTFIGVFVYMRKSEYKLYR